MDLDMVLGNNPSPEVIVTLVGIADCQDWHSQSGSMAPKCQHVLGWHSRPRVSAQPSMVTGSMEIDTNLTVVETQTWPMYTVHDWTTSLPQVEVWATQFYKVPMAI